MLVAAVAVNLHYCYSSLLSFLVFQPNQSSTLIVSGVDPKTLEGLA